MNDVEQAAQRAREDEHRAGLKRAADQRPITVRDSADPTTGLQPAIGSHDAWPYRPAKPTIVGRPVAVDQRQRDLAEERRQAEGDTFVPRCTGCLGRLDPRWCGHIADDDRDAR